MTINDSWDFFVFGVKAEKSYFRHISQVQIVVLFTFDFSPTVQDLIHWLALYCIVLF